MTAYEEIKKHLESSPRARERANKNKFIAWLLDKTYHCTLAGINLSALENLIVDASSYDRAWRQVLQHEPNLRGSDYEDKVLVEQAKELELGYQPKIPQDKHVERQM